MSPDSDAHSAAFTVVDPEPEKLDQAMVAEGRRRVCLTTAVQMLLHNLLLSWEVVDYAKYLEDYLRDGTVPREEDLPAPPKPKKKPKLH